MAADDGEQIDGGVWTTVIEEAVKAGIFRRAERLSPKAKIWRDLGDEHSRIVATLLDEALDRRQLGCRRPSA